MCTQKGFPENLLNGMILGNSYASEVFLSWCLHCIDINESKLKY